MQHIIVGIIVLGCILYVIRRIIQYIRQISCPKSPCDGCSGCEPLKKKQEYYIKKS